MGNAVLFFVSLIALLGEYDCLDNGLALTPPMGWSSNVRFACVVDCKRYPNHCLSAKLIKSIADELVEGGYAKMGYEYVLLEHCWQNKTRAPDGRIQADAERFPDGMKALVDYVHSKGLKFGIASTLAVLSCHDYPGSRDYKELDAKTYAEWGVDYVKMDDCYLSRWKEFVYGYIEFGEYLNKTGRTIMYHNAFPPNGWGPPLDYPTLKDKVNIMRNTGDMTDSAGSLVGLFGFYAQNSYLIEYAGPGHFNFPGELLIGNFGLTLEQCKMQMAMWAILAAPLFITSDIRSIRPEFRDVLLHPDVLAINQDAMGRQGRFVSQTWNSIQMWNREIEPVINDQPSYAIVIINTQNAGMPTGRIYTMKDLGIAELPDGYFFTDVYQTGVVDPNEPVTEIDIDVNPAGCVFLRAEPFL